MLSFNRSCGFVDLGTKHSLVSDIYWNTVFQMLLKWGINTSTACVCASVLCRSACWRNYASSGRKFGQKATRRVITGKTCKNMQLVCAGGGSADRPTALPQPTHSATDSTSSQQSFSSQMTAPLQNSLFCQVGRLPWWPPVGSFLLFRCKM